jgi:hypothetical protein
MLGVLLALLAIFGAGAVGYVLQEEKDSTTS